MYIVERRGGKEAKEGRVMGIVNKNYEKIKRIPFPVLLHLHVYCGRKESYGNCEQEL